ncbi:hypothetical protein [Actinocorallia populi]|uniref:hypothetical protein n=1 Tax=Actinocorallia populi TaxID=2079200 RepID=UPI000D097D65|nr:hypothetical protein [Actinocorallia populi]
MAFDINGYRPPRLCGFAAISEMHADRLRSLVGRRLSSVWVVWDLEDDSWFADCPVLLSFEGAQVEIDHSKFSDVSITWNEIDPLAPVIWPDSELEFRLRWREDERAGMAALHGRALTAVELLEWSGRDMAHGMVAVSFVFDDGRITVHNALDENGLELTPPDPHYRVHRL